MPIRRRDLLGVLTGGSLAPLLNAQVSAAAKLPNIVFILADDLGWGDLGCYNPQSRIPTPNLDRLAASGIRFTDAHTPSAVCTPTRYGLLTGRYAWRTRLKQGVLDGFDPPLIDQGRLTAASLLKSKGYATACFGKWHLGMQWTRKDGTAVLQRDAGVGFRPGDDVDYAKPATGGPLDCGFDTYFGISASLDMPPYCFIDGNRTVGIPDVATPEDKSLFMNQPPGVRTRDFTLQSVIPSITEKAVDWIGRKAREKTPFFVYMPLSSPHLPIVPNEKFKGKSRAGLYGDFVVEMDDCVGQVLAAIERAGVANNTAVFFSSDNGGLWHSWQHQEADDRAAGRITPRGQYTKDFGHHSNAHLRGTKADAWEGGHRVPLIVRWPGKIKAGVTHDGLVCLTDFVATCAAITGSRLPSTGAAEDSISMLPALAGGKSKRDDAVLHTLRGVFVLRSGPWKLIESRGSGGFSQPVARPPKTSPEPEGQLYHLEKDPQETRNVWADHPEVVKQLREKLDRYRSLPSTRLL